MAVSHVTEWVAVSALPVKFPTISPINWAFVKFKLPVLVPFPVVVPIVNLSSLSSQPIKALSLFPRSIIIPESFTGFPVVPLPNSIILSDICIFSVDTVVVVPFTVRLPLNIIFVPFIVSLNITFSTTSLVLNFKYDLLSSFISKAFSKLLFIFIWFVVVFPLNSICNPFVTSKVFNILQFKVLISVISPLLIFTPVNVALVATFSPIFVLLILPPSIVKLCWINTFPLSIPIACKVIFGKFIFAPSYVNNFILPVEFTSVNLIVIFFSSVHVKSLLSPSIFIITVFI